MKNKIEVKGYITVKVSGTEITLTTEEARKLYEDLGMIINKPLSFPPYPVNPYARTTDIWRCGSIHKTNTTSPKTQ